MKKIALFALLLLCLGACKKDNSWTVASPDGRVSVRVDYQDDTNGTGTRLTYRVYYDGREAVLQSPLGIDREDASFSRNLKLASEERSFIDEAYTLKSGKRVENHAQANESVLTFKNESGDRVQLVLRAYNDGIAFRYRFPDEKPGEYKVVGEKTGFRISTGGKAWIHPYDWNSRLKPSYEQYCENEMAVGTDSPYEQGWGFPMLFNVDGLWMMITEAVLDGTYCATHIHSGRDGLYKVAFAEKEEVIIDDDPEPVSTLPWATPWRVVIVGGELADIVETNLVQHLNPPVRIADQSWIKPGRSSWSWWSSGGTTQSYDAQVEYIDFTSSMGWEYVLVDAGWPRMKGGTMEELVSYAASKNVGIWLWYHSGAGRTGNEIDINNLMSFPQERRAEFARLQRMGVKGVKIDFFDTDKQGIVKLYEEILSDAADHRIMVNFHGASLPRGTERTWPNLMTTEAIKGAEGFGRQPACDRAAWHNTTVPFTRNVVGSMDYTPVTFSNKVRQGVEAFNRTTYAHQLALSVIFESGVQNFADNYRSYESLPKGPKDFLKNVPVAWDETKLVAGYPGDFVVMARRKGDKWYIGGINGKEQPRQVDIHLPFIPDGKPVSLLTDGEDRTGFTEAEARTGGAISVKMAPNGGFAGVIQL